MCIYVCVCVRVIVVLTVVVVIAEAGTSPAKQLMVLGTWHGYPGSCLVRNLATNFVEPFKLQSLNSLPSSLSLLSSPPCSLHLPYTILSNRLLTLMLLSLSFPT